MAAWRLRERTRYATRLRVTMIQKLTIAGAILALVGCSSNPEGPTVEHFTIHVDSVQAPATVSRDAPLSIQFYGTIGSNLCFEFDRFEVEQTHSQLDLTLWGRVEVPRGICPLALSELDGRSFVKPAPHDAGTVTIVVHQPDGSKLELSVAVTD